jgi:energy-coupling factor transporter ATP-binding protein EcfA2
LPIELGNNWLTRACPLLVDAAYFDDELSRHTSGPKMTSATINPKDPIRITSIKVIKLFGLYNYTLTPDRSDADIGRFFILYGDNGSGKTRILNIIFSLLMAGHKDNSKTYIARTPFHRFVVEFNNGISVSAERPKNKLVGAYKIKISQPGTRDFQCDVSRGRPDLVKPVRECLASFHIDELDRRHTAHADDIASIVAWVARKKGATVNLCQTHIVLRLMLEHLGRVDLEQFNLFKEIRSWATA